MEMQHFILSSMVVVQTTCFVCLYFPGYPNRPVSFGLKRSVVWRFYVAVNDINVLRSWTV